MERWVGRVVVVTGASSGIGEAITKRLVGHGMKVIGCARNIQKIQEMATELKDEKGSLTAIQCDVKNEEEVVAIFESIKATHGVVHVCINNAGLAHDAPLLTGKTEQWRDMFEVNVIGLCTCTREAVKLMDEKGVDDGHIFLLNSISGHRVSKPTSENIYSATKFAVTAITEGLRNELVAKKSHIRVTGISPGWVRTDFAYRMFPDEPEKAAAIYNAYETMQPDDIVDSLVYALSAPQRAQVHDILIRPTEAAS